MARFDFQNAMNTFLDKLPFGKRQNDGYDQEYDDTYDQYGDQYADQYGEQEPYDAYADQAAYGYEEPAEEPFRYESTYNSGTGHVIGVKPSSPKKKNTGRGVFDRFSAQPRQDDYDARGAQRQPSNVISMPQYEQQDDYTYRGPRSGGGQEFSSRERPYYQPTQEPAREAAPQKAQQQRQQSTLIYLVRRMEDVEEIISYMVDGGNVIVNMEEIDEGLKARVLDFISGAAFALEGSVKRISYRTYFVALNGEEVVSNIAMSNNDEGDDGFRPSRGNRDYRY